jgi:ParB family chromosome partitioning protein
MAAENKKPAGRRLGRGLGSLIGNPVAITPAPPTPASAVPTPVPGPTRPVVSMSPTPEPPRPPSGSGVRMLRIELVRPNPHQPRQRFDEEALQRLADSIKTAGLMQPIVVRPSDAGFEIVAGERRWRAFQKLGKPEIPAIVRAVDDQTAAEWALVENLQREDLDPMERADGVARLMDEFGLSQSAVAMQLGLDRSTVANLLRLRDADPPLREALASGLITQGHAKALLGLTDLKRRADFLAACVREGWSVREVERRVQALSREPVATSSADAATPRSAHVADLEKRLGTHLGTKVGINLGRQKGRGKVVIEFYSLQQFDGILEKIGFDSNAEG